MKRGILILAILGLMSLAGCMAAVTGNSGDGGNKLKKSPCASLILKDSNNA